MSERLEVKDLKWVNRKIDLRFNLLFEKTKNVLTLIEYLFQKTKCFHPFRFIHTVVEDHVKVAILCHSLKFSKRPCIDIAHVSKDSIPKIDVCFNENPIPISTIISWLQSNKGKQRRPSKIRANSINWTLLCIKTTKSSHNISLPPWCRLWMLDECNALTSSSLHQQND